MELFQEPKIGWMSKKWFFIGMSLILLATGLVSVIVRHGLTYGIDFRGGTMVYVKFAQTPELDDIRRALESHNIRNATLQRYGSAADHEVIVGLDLQTTASSDEIDIGKRTIMSALASIYGAGPAGKLDFNNASPQTVAERLVAADPLRQASAGIDVVTKTYRDMGEVLVNFRNGSPRSGLVASFEQLSEVPGVNPAVLSALQNDFYLSSYAIRNTEVVGPKVGADLRRQAIYVTLAGLAAMLIYIWFRFELIYGIAAVVATFHDVLVTLGIFSLLEKEITLTVIAALLTLVGYSMNDTIVVFDRIRENIRLNRRGTFVELVDHSINQTLSRTVLTSGLTFLTVLALYLFGGEVIHGFAFAMVVGFILGSYSTIFIACPIVAFFQQRAGRSSVGERPKAYVREAAGMR